MESAILKIVERQEKLYKQIIKTEIVRDEIETAINSLPDDLQESGLLRAVYNRDVALVENRKQPQYIR